jgi:hypothetical protein
MSQIRFVPEHTKIEKSTNILGKQTELHYKLIVVDNSFDLLKNINIFTIYDAFYNGSIIADIVAGKTDSELKGVPTKVLTFIRAVVEVIKRIDIVPDTLFSGASPIKELRIVICLRDLLKKTLSIWDILIPCRKSGRILKQSYTITKFFEEVTKAIYAKHSAMFIEICSPREVGSHPDEITQLGLKAAGIEN